MTEVFREAPVAGSLWKWLADKPSAVADLLTSASGIFRLSAC